MLKASVVPAIMRFACSGEFVAERKALMRAIDEAYKKVRQERVCMRGNAAELVPAEKEGECLRAGVERVYDDHLLQQCNLTATLVLSAGVGCCHGNKINCCGTVRCHPHLVFLNHTISFVPLLALPSALSLSLPRASLARTLAVAALTSTCLCTGVLAPTFAARRPP